ncbi:hypothetical protein ALC57_07586 [Trachymyrmex cornetzi]|uniref:Uncharacterized protein n=1 Tax=Trachymyrmex cornetzi TaxID=471704 RepID=A0A151J811_9HYME|nr:hypothetical protein ALC57_07586 [Trachymyrmex cornetzi]
MRQISVVLPNTVTVPQNLHNCLSKDTNYYRINKLHVSDLLNIEFIEAFVKKGKSIIDFLYLVKVYLRLYIYIYIYVYMYC